MTEKNMNEYRENRSLGLGRIVCCISVFVLGFMFLLAGCGKKIDKEGMVDVYYVNSESNGLVSLSYKMEEENNLRQVKELYEQMVLRTKKIHYQPAILYYVPLLGIELEDGVLSLDFGNDYLIMDNMEETMCRAALVYTMTQIEGVESLKITVAKQPLRDENGRIRSNMTRSDFVDASAGAGGYVDVAVVLYYSNEEGTKLVPIPHKGRSYGNKTMEEYIIQKMIDGPEREDLGPTMSGDVKLNSVTTRNGTCYVDFNEAFLRELSTVSPKVQFYSLVNSLCELSYVNKVQISIDGDTTLKFSNLFPLSNIYERNLDVVTH